MSGESEEKRQVKTSTRGWLKEVAEAYRNRVPILIDDDAQVGINPKEDSLLKMGIKAKLSAREWAGVCLSLGVAGIGVWLIVMAVLDPEPFSKVALVIVTGALLLGTGGLVAVRVLTHLKPPNIRIFKTGIFEIYWD
jgi:hypothetical protein